MCILCSKGQYQGLTPEEKIQQQIFQQYQEELSIISLDCEGQISYDEINSSQFSIFHQLMKIVGILSQLFQPYPDHQSSIEQHHL